MSKRHRGGAVRIAAAALFAAAGLMPFGAGPAAAADSGRTPRPTISIEKKGECVAPVDEMRRNHMLMLQHDRDTTVHQGIRKVRASLKGCVDCHASSKTGSVIASKDDFCASCHAYAGVKLDCFGCHAASPKNAPARQGRDGPSTADLLASMLRGGGGEEIDKGTSKP